jgi:dipeptidase
MRPFTASLLLVAALGALASPSARACTNLLVSRGATRDGSTFITYTADSHSLYGSLVHSLGGVYPAGATREIIEWDTGRRLGEIAQAPRTYTVVGNMNEHQVAIGETTFGGRAALANPDGKLDYGSMIMLGLERARTAREAVLVMTSLAEKHGFASDGESLSISDPKEVWYLEIVGAGKGAKAGEGAIWVARRLPDGTISAHANQARIRTFPRNDPGTLYSKNVVSFARAKGWWKGADKDFSFADTYGPATWTSMRACEARVWSIFRRVSRGAWKYLDWVKGKEGAEPLPLFIKPDRKLAVQDAMELMRDHFQGTEFDLGKDIGAGAYDLPYRWRPLTFYTEPACDLCAKEKDPKKKRKCLEAKRCVEYVNERAISTQQTGFSFVAQARASLPAPIGGVLWFGVDDTASTVYVPIYAGVLRAPRAFAEGTGDFKTFTWESAFWVFNAVANFAYSRYRDMIVDIRRVQRELEGSFLARQAEVEKHALVLHKQSPESAREYLTRYSEEQTKRTVDRWRRLLPELLLKYLDGNVRDEHGKPKHPGYPKAWLKRIVKERGEHLRVRKLKGELPEEELH